jgi:hypothetical protein
MLEFAVKATNYFIRLEWLARAKIAHVLVIIVIIANNMLFTVGGSSTENRSGTTASKSHWITIVLPFEAGCKTHIGRSSNPVQNNKNR